MSYLIAILYARICRDLGFWICMDSGRYISRNSACFQWSEGHEPNPFFPCKNNTNTKLLLPLLHLHHFESSKSTACRRTCLALVASNLPSPVPVSALTEWQILDSELWQVHVVKRFTQNCMRCIVLQELCSHIFLIFLHSPTARVRTGPACTCFSTLWWAMSLHYAQLVLPGSANVVCWAPLQSWKIQSEVNQ